MAPEYEKPQRPIREVKRGWVAKDILDIGPIFHNLDKDPRLEYAQAASPGLAVDVEPDQKFELSNLHEHKQLYAFSLPGEVPAVKVGIGPGSIRGG